MKNKDILNQIKKIHFIGIGGISMSGLAEILHRRGYKVTGSDSGESDLTKHLQKLGITVYKGHSASNISPETELIVYTAAISEDNPELIEAGRRNIKIMDRAMLLGIIMSWYPFSVAVAGTHGKTTTTSMVSDIFLSAGKEPTITLGGMLPSINSNFRIGSSEFFIAEACEYFDSFLKFYPTIGIILNVEADHLDYFKDLEHIESSFRSFAENIPDGGALVINGSIPSLNKITPGLTCKVLTYGTPEDDWYAEDITHIEEGYAFNVVGLGKNMGRFTLKMYGEHNIQDALAACAACYEAGISPEEIRHGLAVFKGPRRRFEYIGSVNGVNVIDDYAHHPTEIKACLMAARDYPHKNIFCVFQPHNYTRTRSLLNEFADALILADKVVLLDIYSNRESNMQGVHSLNLLEKIKEKGKEAYYFSTFDDAEKFLLKKSFPGDLLITMGAGNVNFLGENILRTGLSTLSTDF